MKYVDQTVIDGENGDCHRAVIASILELDITQVPHFRLYDDQTWFRVYHYFLLANGWEYTGYRTIEDNTPIESDSIEGFFDATVDSRTFPGKKHAVVIDLKGVVVHDPNPNRKWMGRDVIETGELRGWTAVKRYEGS